ncbi:MAG: D-alanine--D-alanine ligase [Candidatus Eisenbacteria bacterium]|nr:D-alanine--D-alanine ligase [Candidatus Eisenbacteria bacterium]
MRVAVIYGGASAEREVSLVTGRAVAAALRERGHEACLVDTASKEPAGRESASDATARAIMGEDVARAEVVFVALHGGAGENGTVQGLLELAGKRYTGSGVFASALAMDKRMSKLAFRAAGVPTPEWRMVLSDDAAGSAAGSGSPVFPDDLSPGDERRAARELGGYPIIVKPNDQGSTVGLTLVEDEKALAGAFELAADHSSHVLFERYIPGRELTVAVLEGTRLPLVEAEPSTGLYDYECKYTKGMTEYTCPADVPGDIAEKMTDAGHRAFESLGCHGYGRVDFRLAPDGRFYCLEVNTVPGMTDVSLVPMAAAAAGVSFGELCERIAETALS